MRPRRLPPTREMWATLWTVYGTVFLIILLWAEWEHYDTGRILMWNRWLWSWLGVFIPAFFVWLNLRSRWDVYCINHGGEVFEYVARTHAEALELFRKEWEPDSDDDPPVVDRLPRYWPVTVSFPDDLEHEGFPGATVTPRHEERDLVRDTVRVASLKVTANAGDWARHYSKPGLVSSTVY